MNHAGHQRKSSSAAIATTLDDLQSTLEREIPMSAQMGMRVHEGGLGGLVMRLPLKPNLNHQQTAFAGSLSALCTIAGWGYVFLLLRELGREGNIVIHRSTIKYLQPVTSSEIYAHCKAVTEGRVSVLPRNARRQRANEARPDGRDSRQVGAVGIV